MVLWSQVIFSGLVTEHEGTVFKPYQFKMEEIEGFKYRAKVNIVLDFKCLLPMFHRNPCFRVHKSNLG